MPDLPTTPQTSAIVESAAGTVDTAAGTAQASQLVDTVQQTAATPDVKSVTDQATATVSQATDPVVKGTVETVTQATDPVVNTTTTTVTQAADPVVSGAGAATGGAGSAVKQTVDTVTSTAAQATAPVRPVVDTVATTTAAATAPVRPVVETVAAAPTAVARAAEPVVSGQGAPRAADLADAIAGPTGQATHQAVASATGGSSSAINLLPTHGGSGPRGGLADALAAASNASGLAAPPAGDPGALAAPPAVDPTTASLLAHAAPAPAPGGAAHGTATDTLAQVATDPRLLAVTGVTALAGSAYVAARAAGCVAGGESSVILNNVRLIPCLARTSMTAGGTAIAGLGSGVREAAGFASRATRDELHVLGEHVSSAAGKVRQDLADHVVEPFRDGLARATGDAPDGAAPATATCSSSASA